MKLFSLALSLILLSACGSGDSGANGAETIPSVSETQTKIECGTDDWCEKLCLSRFNLYMPSKTGFSCHSPETYPGECEHMDRLYQDTLRTHMNVYYQCLASDKDETVDNITRWNSEKDPTGAWKYHLFDPSIWVKP